MRHVTTSVLLTLSLASLTIATQGPAGIQDLARTSMAVA